MQYSAKQPNSIYRNEHSFQQRTITNLSYCMRHILHEQLELQCTVLLRRCDRLLRHEPHYQMLGYGYIGCACLVLDGAIR